MDNKTDVIDYGFNKPEKKIEPVNSGIISSKKPEEEPVNYGFGFKPLSAPLEEKTPEPVKTSGGFTDTAKDVGIKLAQGVVGVGQSVIGLGNLATGGKVGEIATALGDKPEERKAQLGTHLSQAQKDADAKVQNAQGFTNTVGAALSNPRAILGAVAESAPAMLTTMLPGAAAAKLTNMGKGAIAGVGAASEGALTSGSIAESAEREGREYSDYALPALGAGAATAAIGKLSSKLGGDVATDIVTGARPGAGTYLKNVAKSTATEAMEEGAQSGQETINTNIAMGEKDITKGVGNAIGMGAVTGGAMGGGMAALNRPVSPITGEELPQTGGTLANAANAAGVTPPQPEPTTPTNQTDNTLNQWATDSHTSALALRNQLAASEGLSARDFNIQQNSDGSFILARKNPIEQAPTNPEMQNRDRSSNASVMQMQQIAKAPDYDRLATGNGMDDAAPMVSVKANAPTVAPAQMGKELNATLSDGTKIPSRYAVVDAGSVLTSHDASGNVIPDYAKPADGSLVALNNGRTAGLQAAYKNGNAEDYKQKLMADTSHGIDPAEIAKFDNPMLVRVYDDNVNSQIPNIGAKSNSRSNLALSTIEQAQTDASNLSDDTAFGLAHPDLTHGDNADFISNTLDQITPANERAQLIDNQGRLNQAGLKRVQSAIALKAYDAPDIIKDNFESLDPEIKGIGNALVNVAPNMVQLKTAAKTGQISPDWDITPAITAAAQIVRQAKAENKPVLQFTSNNQLNPEENISPATLQVLGLMFKDSNFTRQRSAKDIADKLSQYSNAALKSNNADIFSETATPQSILSQLNNNAADNAQASEVQSQVQSPSNADSQTPYNTWETSNLTNENGNVAEENPVSGATSAIPPVSDNGQQSAREAGTISGLSDESLREAPREIGVNDNIANLPNGDVNDTLPTQQNAPLQIPADSEAVNSEQGAATPQAQSLPDAAASAQQEITKENINNFFLRANKTPFPTLKGAEIAIKHNPKFNQKTHEIVKVSDGFAIKQKPTMPDMPDFSKKDATIDRLLSMDVNTQSREMLALPKPARRLIAQAKGLTARIENGTLKRLGVKEPLNIAPTAIQEKVAESVKSNRVLNEIKDELQSIIEQQGINEQSEVKAVLPDTGTGEDRAEAAMGTPEAVQAVSDETKSPAKTLREKAKKMFEAAGDWEKRNYKDTKLTYESNDIYGDYAGDKSVKNANERRRQRNIESYNKAGKAFNSFADILEALGESKIAGIASNTRKAVEGDIEKWFEPNQTDIVWGTKERSLLVHRLLLAIAKAHNHKTAEKVRDELTSYPDIANQIVDSILEFNQEDTSKDTQKDTTDEDFLAHLFGINEKEQVNAPEPTKQDKPNEQQSSDGDAGKTPTEPRIPAKQPGVYEQKGDSPREGTVSARSTDAAIGNNDNGATNGLPETSREVGRYSPDRASEPNEQRGTGKDGSLPRDNGSNNYSLEGKEPISLTPAKRRDANNAALEILKKPVDDITEADKDILRQYTGSGGLNLNDSLDKGAGIFNQHFSDYETIKGMYSALSDAGIKTDGRNLEPSVGSGNFIGLNPRAQWDAVDIDGTNTDVVKVLYPDAKVSTESYETFNGKNYDLIISNVPFASFSSLAREHAATIKPAFKAIHNFYFAHSMDKLKDGGVMAFMTSTGTMEGTTEAKNLRRYLTNRADVIGAFRLPMGTQKGNASTEVMIDVIYLQKRPEGVESKQQDKNDAFVNNVMKDGHKINQYFVDYPDSVLGDLSIAPNKTSMGKVEWIVTGTPDYSKMILQPQVYTNADKQNKTSFKNNDEALNYANENGLKYKPDVKRPIYEDGYIYDQLVSYDDHEGMGAMGRKAAGINAEKLNMLSEIEQTQNKNLIESYKSQFQTPPHTDKALANFAKSNYANKQGFNDVFWKQQNESTADVSPEAPPSAYDAAIELEKDPYKKRKLEIQRDLEMSNNVESGIRRQISSIAKRIGSVSIQLGQHRNANIGIDTREPPKYEDMKAEDRAEAIEAFKQRMAKQKASNLQKIGEFEKTLETLNAEKVTRQADLQAHLDKIKETRDKYVVNGQVSIDAIKLDAKPSGIKFSKSGATKEQLLAPNGKPSNLNARQHAQVRTPEFKKWFGNWENDPANASKVVDENGEPLIQYHGTMADTVKGQTFDSFNTKYNDLGSHFGDKNTANSFASSQGGEGRVKPVFLNIKNPIRLKDIGAFDFIDIGDQLLEKGILTEAEFSFIESQVETADATNDIDVWDESRLSVLNQMQEALIDKGYDGIIYLNRREGMSKPTLISLLKHLSSEQNKWNDEEFKKNAPDAVDSRIVFNPNQIKSAISNTGAFNQENNDIRYSFAGKNALTANIGTLEEAQARLAKGEDAEHVRQETGWHIGVDGKPRFEIDDSLASLAIESPSFERMAEINGDFISSSDFLLKHPNTPEAKAIRVKNSMRSGKLNDDTPTLPSILNHHTLYEAYPSLNDIKVVIDDSMPIGSAAYSEEQNAIILSPSSDEMILSNILHEAQHIIQRHEGFATGGSPAKEIKEYKQKITEKKDNLLKEYLNLKDVKKKTKEQKQNISTIAEEIDNLNEELLSIKSEWYKYFYLYNNLTGEVEARNTQSRQNLTEEQRRATSPQSTQDVADKDQIVRFNSLRSEYNKMGNFNKAPSNTDTRAAYIQNNIVDILDEIGYEAKPTDTPETIRKQLEANKVIIRC